MFRLVTECAACTARGACGPKPRRRHRPGRGDKIEASRMMRTTLASLLFGIVATAQTSAPGAADQARWKQRAAVVTIIRDDWGIAHVYGESDADTVFGAIYAQAEDDFNRVETNYINAMGRLAEAEGESKIYQDLRMKLFIDPALLQKQYAESPEWLQKLMNAF